MVKILEYSNHKKRIVIITIIGIIAITILTIIVLWNDILNSKSHHVIGIARWGNSSEYSENIQGFKDALDESGFIEGKNVEYIVKSAELNSTKQKIIIQDFIDKKVDLIYSLTTPGTLIAKNMTRNIPIVFSIVTYPAEVGLVENLEHSGNMLTGTRNYISAATQLDLFSDIIPVKKIGFIHRHGEPNSAIQFDEMKSEGDHIGITLVDVSSRNLGELSQKINDNIQDVDALYQACDTLVQNGGEEIAIKAAMKYKKPTFSCNSKGVEMGALFGDVANFSKIGHSAGMKAAMVMTGGQPSDIAIESPNDGDILINLKTANYLGIKIPPHIYEITDQTFR